MEAKRTTLGNQLIRGNGGYELALAAVLLGVFGFWLDGRYDTRPVFMLVLGTLGFIGAGLSMYYRFKNSIAELQAETDELRAAANG